MATKANGQITSPLYNGEIPNSKPCNEIEHEEVMDKITLIHKISIPTLTAFLPPKEKANGTAVIICPGGGYWVNAMVHEGLDVARKLNDLGIAAFVLKYRIPSDCNMIDPKIGPLQDAQKAIKTVREKSAEWGINADKIGILGFSAGGHLAATAGTLFESNFLPEHKGVSLRPDFMILVYPVISFQDELCHLGSRDKLIGINPDLEIINKFSPELQITSKIPPTFLIHATDDDAVKVENSITFYKSLLNQKIPAEMHIYQNGGHGFGMINPTTEDLWMDRCNNWMKSNGFGK